MSLRHATQRFAKAEPLITAWVLVFLLAEVTALLAIVVVGLLA